ncbi:Putative membrane protein [Sphingopyxis fribergensis]|uniref:Putative membrane protein n=1 Tax=Sphingopyxis fribergensis TaxID=1515612 RepID=A0A0A7PHM3_9SPHN|nr:DUF423 domain-containing protein [Sphingopyxis fribergensis]AJA09505.1 Putative membrane protein [Sphingopyxis fribergensis]
MAIDSALFPRPAGLWTRRLWMRCAAISGCMAMVIWIWGNLSGSDLETRYFRLAAQIQFIHSMTCFGSATFMNLGAHKARHAPGFFLAGSFFLCGSLYLAPYYRGPFQLAAGCIGSAGLLAGWIVLIVAAGSIDRGDP